MGYQWGWLVGVASWIASGIASRVASWDTSGIAGSVTSGVSSGIVSWSAGGVVSWDTSGITGLIAAIVRGTRCKHNYSLGLALCDGGAVRGVHGGHDAFACGGACASRVRLVPQEHSHRRVPDSTSIPRS